MRIFLENTKEFIENPNLEIGKIINNETNEYTWNLIIDSEGNFHYEDENGKVIDIETAKDILVHKVWDEEPKSHYEYESFSGFSGNELVAPVGFISGQKEYEEVGIYHYYTQEELDEIERQKKEAEEKALYNSKVAENNELMYENQSTNSVIYNDSAVCVVYETLTQTQNIQFTDVEPFCQSYARRIHRGVTTLEECPVELQKRIKEIGDSDKDCVVNHISEHCKLVGLEDKYERNTGFYFEIVPEDNYRLPYYEEFEENISVIAYDEDGSVISNFFEDNCSWEEEERNAYVGVNIPDNCYKINATIKCIKE